MRKEKGFTLIELLIVLAVLAVIAAILLPNILSTMRPNPDKVRATAKDYTEELGYEVLGISCTGTDSDGDGYVSCTVRAVSKPSRFDIEREPVEKTFALECASGVWFRWTSGCKQAVMTPPPTS